jgi:hypothetical protein
VYTAAETSRREQLVALLRTVEGEDWDRREPYKAYAATLGQDREAMVALELSLLKRTTDWPWYREATARMLGYADDPRIVAAFASRRAALVQQRAELPAALAKEGLSMLPPAPIAVR